MKIAGVIVLSIALMLVIFTLGIVNVKPTEVAVNINKVAGKVNPMPEGVGYHLFNRWITDMVIYNIATKSYPSDIIKRRGQGNEMMLAFKTTDGQNVQCDFTVQYALISKEVPLLHAEVGRNYEEEILMPKLRSISRVVLGGFSAEELYQGKVRDDIQQAIRDRLIRELAPYHMLIKASLIRDFKFSPQFEQKIEEKKLAAQQVEINKNKALAQEEEAKRVEAQARGEKLKAVQEASGRAESKKIEADAERYKLEQEAKGNLAIYKADAEGKRLMTQALGGGQFVVGLRFAEKLAPGIQTVTVPISENGNYIMDISDIMKKALRTN